MFYINKDTVLTKALLEKMIQKFMLGDKAKRQKYKDYYDGKQNILLKKYADASKPCNKTVIGYCSNIANSYSGYIASPAHISYRSKDDIEDVMEILRYNDYQTEDASFLLDALIYGTAAELMYFDKDGKTRFRLINPTTCFGIYEDSLTGDLLYFVRIYRENEWDDTETYLVDVYSNYGITKYRMNGMSGYLTLLESEVPHYFSQCPANIFSLPDEKSIFDCVMSKVDSINELISAEIDEYSAFADCYLTLTAADLLPEDVAEMKKNRVLVLPEGATAAYLTKNANDTQVENIRKYLHDSIYRDAQCPDFSSETFVGGVSSGIAIQYRLTGMETRAGIIEALMKKALQRRVELICGVAALKLGESVFRDIEISFKRNIPEDITSIINVTNALKGTVSDATLLSQIPFITDVNGELEAVQEQKERNMAIYSFAPAADDEAEVE